ncbi:MAG TPA: DinB family protein [Candidatus Acidoferrales bacterium]|nr:DinB family protein [Candidatus Acidoferrales bacterium]
MPELAVAVNQTLAAYYEEVRERVHHWVAPLTTAQLWRKPYPYGNSAGHLLLHLTGNLNHYIGAGIAKTGYLRNRPLEFSDTSNRSKEQMLADFDAAISMVAATVRAQSPEDLVAPYSDPTEPLSNNRFAVFMRMAAHAYHHVGQIIYLSKELTK